MNYKRPVFYTVEIGHEDGIRLECSTLRQALEVADALRGTRAETEQTVNVVAWDSRNDADGGPNGMILDQFTVGRSL